MFDGLRRAIGAISVREEKGKIYVSGVPADVIARDIARIWNTSRVNSYMFTQLGRSGFSFHSFYAIEIYFVLEHLKTHPQAYTNQRALRRIQEELKAETWLRTLEDDASLNFNWSRLKELTVDPKAHQREFLEVYEKVVAQYQLRGYLLAAPPGTGKAQPLDSLVKVPGGWKTMGEMSVGDDVVAADGTTTKVLGVFPQGVRPVYEVTFVDGRVVRADADHLWEIHDRDVAGGKSIIKTTELQHRLQMSSKRGRLYVPLCKSEPGIERDLPIDPYVLGALLGDGGLTHYVGFSSPDESILEAVRVEAERLGCVLKKRAGDNIDYVITGTTHGSNPVMRKLQELGLFGKSSYFKFIPNDYLGGSHEQRLALLQGLMDTDGYIDPNSNMCYTTTSFELAEHVAYLVRSIGGIADIVSKVKYFTYKGIRKQGAPAYQVNIRHGTPSLFFRLEKKAIRANDNHQYSAGLKLRVESVEFVGVEETQCIQIAHPDHLYVTDGFVVTHNTLGGIMLSLVHEADCTVIICPKRALFEVWADTIKTRFKSVQRYWTSGDNTPIDQEATWLVFHYEALEQALSWIANNKKFKRISIILDECHNLNDPKSARTQNFMELCKDPNILSVLWMSGTPIKALGNEAIPFLSTIDSRFTEKVRESFTKIFGKQVSRAVEILANRIGISSFKVPKADVVTNEVIETTKNVAFKGGEQFTLAVIKEEIRKFVEERFVYYKENERRFHNIYFEILAIYERSIRDETERKEFKLYRQYVDGLNKRFDPVADKDIVVWCNRFEERYICPKLSNSDRKEFRHVRSIYKYVSLKIRGEALGRILTKRRIACFVSMVPHCGLPELIDSAEKKTLIFTSYVEVVKAAEAYLKKEGYQPLLVFGDTNKNLPMIMKQFKENPDLNPMIATYDSLSTAVPVIEANHVVLLNKPFRDHEYQQATSRVNRLGQDSIVRITSMLLDTGQEPNLSTRSNEIMEWSRASVNAIMGMDGVDETITTEDNFVLEDGDDFTKVLLELVDEPYSPGSAAIHAPDAAQVSMSKENYFFLF